MKRLLVFLMFFLVHCKTKEYEPIENRSALNSTRTDKIDAGILIGNLKVKPYIEGGYQGHILIPSLPVEADFMFVKVCNAKKTMCIEDTLDGASASPRKDLPKGELIFSFKVCVYPHRAQTQGVVCGLEKTTTYTPSK